jgi:hypothetical protein
VFRHTLCCTCGTQVSYLIRSSQQHQNSMPSLKSNQSSTVPVIFHDQVAPESRESIPLRPRSSHHYHYTVGCRAELCDASWPLIHARGRDTPTHWSTSFSSSGFSGDQGGDPGAELWASVLTSDVSGCTHGSNHSTGSSALYPDSWRVLSTGQCVAQASMFGWHMLVCSLSI